MLEYCSKKAKGHLIFGGGSRGSALSIFFFQNWPPWPIRAVVILLLLFFFIYLGGGGGGGTT